MEIKFRGQYTKKQYFKGMALAAKQPRSQLIKRIVYFLVFATIYAVLIYHTLQQEGIESFEIARALKHLVIVGTLGYAIFRPAINTYTTASRLWKDPIVRGMRTGTITEEGINYYDQVIKKWNYFIVKRFTDEMVVLVSTNGNISIFPSHFFRDENDWNAFRQVVEFKVVEAR